MGKWEEDKEHNDEIDRKAREIVKRQNEKAAEEEREKERRVMAENGEAPLFAMVKPSLGWRRSKIAITWMLAEDVFRWMIVALSEMFIGFIAFMVIDSNPFIWFVVLPLLIIPFTPYLYVTYLIKSRRAIFFPEYKGEGFLWQRKAKEIGADLELLNSLATDPDSTKHTKIAYAKMEPLVWSDLVKANRLMNKRKRFKKVDGDAIESINNQYRTLNKRGKDLQEVIVACNSLEVLEVDFDLTTGNAHDIVKEVRDGIKQQRELSAGTIELEG